MSAAIRSVEIWDPCHMGVSLWGIYLGRSGWQLPCPSSSHSGSMLVQEGSYGNGLRPVVMISWLCLPAPPCH